MVRKGLPAMAPPAMQLRIVSAEYHRLVLSFSDGITRESNVFTKKSFEANYTVTIEENDLVVEEGRGYPNPNIFFLVWCILNILLLTGAFFTLIFLIRKGLQARRWINSRTDHQRRALANIRQCDQPHFACNHRH